MSGRFSVEVGPFDPTKITPPDLAPDAYGNHGKNLLEAHLAPKLDPVTWTPTRPRVPTNFFKPPKEDPNVLKKVAIVGAGVGGLYAGMILNSLGIPFEIFEASNRTGGRVFTHKFSDDSHDYYDVGAMRYPLSEPTMRRLLHLLKSHQLNSDDRRVAEKVISYKFGSPNSFRYFNNIRLTAKEVSSQDQFDFKETGVPQQDLDKGYSAIINETFESFVEALRQDLVPPGSKEGWQKMMSQDHHSARSYMAVACNLSMPTIRWCETMDTSTDSYDKAFSEACLDMVAFGTGKTEWSCLDGGSQVLTDAMTDFIEKKSPDSLRLNTRVTGLRTFGEDKVTGITVSVGEKPRTFEHVISTIPLPVFRTLDINDPRLFTVQQTNALRQLSYGPSIKVGIKFKSQWWAGEKLNIVGGQSFTDQNIRTTVYPSYGIEGPNKTTVLIASYTWTSDAAALAALVSPDEERRERLRELVLRDLAHVHNVDIKTLQDEFVDIFSWAWQNDPNSQAAFAFFGPGQYGRLYKSLARPCGDHRLHMAGEALSPRHAWIVGALDASWRAVAEIIIHKGDPELYREFVRMWGKNPEWIASSSFKEQTKTQDWRWGGHEFDLVMYDIVGHEV